MKRLLAVAVLALSVAALFAPARAVLAAPAPAQRVVSGRVLDASDAPVKDAVVYLKDMRTLVVKSYIASADGVYRFGQLSANTDYEIWAVAGGRKSKVHNISSFDTKSLFTIDLKL